MNHDDYLLDTSALITFIEGETGSDRVEEVLRHHKVLIPWMALMETYYITFRERGEAEADTRYALIKQLPASFIWEIDEPCLLTSARLKAIHRLSLADALAASMAIQREAVLMHKDPEFERLRGELSLEPLPYKSE